METLQQPVLPRRPAIRDAVSPRAIPSLEGGLPVLGFALEFQRNPLAVLERGYKAYGGVFEFKLAGQDFVALAGPRAHEAYFNAPETCLSARDVYQFTVPIFGKGVAYDASPERMAEQLGFLRPALGDGRMDRYAEQMQREVHQYLESWGDEGEVDLSQVTQELTVNIAARCLLGREIRERFYDGFADLYRDLQGGMNTLGFFMPKLPTPMHRRRDRARVQVAALLGSVLESRRCEGRREEDFMQTLMDARYADGSALPDDEITGILLATLFGGQHASAVLGAWVGAELLQHPDFLARVSAEVDEILPRPDAVIKFSELKRLSTMECAIRECERLHPPLTMLVRKALTDFEFDGYTIPAGKLVMVSPALSHRLRDVFSDPHRFDPDRFLPPRSEDRSSPYSLIGFGGGRHRCMGFHFAYMEIKMVWATLLSRFELELSSPFPAPDYSNWVTGPTTPCTMRYQRRGD